jgi:hypothetical protein
MRGARIAALILVMGAGVAAAAAAGGPPKAPSGERTHPRLRPAAGGRHTRFTLTFTLRDAPGHEGIFAVDYRVQVSAPAGARASCTPPQPAPIDTGAAGAMEHMPLAPPAHGWCRGLQRVTVFLERGPYCPPPAESQTPAPCPEFATQELDTGDASFMVRP